MDQLYLCRHGETEWTLSGQHTGKTDIPLTEKGKQEAVLLRQQLQKVHFERVFTSPKKRARTSCEGMHAVEDAHLVEWDYGDYEGLTSAEIHQRNAKWNLFREGAPNGESPEQVGKRADEFLKMAGQCRGKVAVFSHGHFLRVLAARFLGLSPEMAKLFFISVASVGILGHERGQPVIILWDDTHHLSP